MDLIIKPAQDTIKESIEPALLKDKPKKKIEYKVPEVNLSDNIRQFDEKPRVYTQNPHDYNSISLKKDLPATPSASEMLVNPLYNKAAKALGVDTVHDWNRYYDKVATLVDWAKQETGYIEPEKIASWIYSQIKFAPSMGARKIDDLYIYSKLKSKAKVPVKMITKTVIKKIYVKEKLSPEEMTKRLIYGT